MLCVSGLAEGTDDVVRVQVNCHSCKEHYRSDDELRACQPSRTIHACRCLTIKPSTYEICVQCIEHQSHEHDGKRHLAFAAHHKREDE